VREERSAQARRRGRRAASVDDTPLVALIGPPNSGKTTLYNRLTGLRQKVANYPGVTVEKHLGRARLPGGERVYVLDLPGINGFSARSADERVTRDALEGRIPGIRAPDAVILIVDSTRFETQLMLVEPVLAREVPTLLVLNMADELDERGGAMRDDVLAKELGVTVVRTDARSGRGVEGVKSFLVEQARRGAGGAGDAGRSGGAGVVGRRANGLASGADSRTGPAVPPSSPRRIELPVLGTFTDRRNRIRLVGQRASYAAPGPSLGSERLDSILLHRVWGPLIFLGVVVLVFQSIFTWATPLMNGVEALVAGSGEWLATRLPDTWWRALLIEGVWGGVGSVVVFLPQILILFLFLGILEDSGYLARAAVIADRLMMRVGLQGRAFLPLLSGYACAVPAILAARTVENERDRLATIFITPFMTCSARLPVYALLIAAFIPDRPLLGPVFGLRAATLLGLYAIGLMAAIGTAFLLKRTLLRGTPSPFLMELPPYRVPGLRTIGLRLLDRSRVFLRRAGRTILGVAIVLWVLTQLPRGPEGPPPVNESALGRIGQVIEPTIAPLGFDWRIGVGLVSSLAAREVIIGTLGTIYGVEDTSDGSLELQHRLRRDLDLGSAIGLLIFFAFALQCMATIAVVHRETGGWKWPALQLGYMLTLAWTGAFLANYFI